MGKRRSFSYKAHVASRFFVRFHMSLILTAVIASGVGASKLLMELGLAEVRVRYPVAVLASYLVFLLLVRLWIWYVDPDRERFQSSLDAADLMDLDLSSGGSGGGPQTFRGFGGGSSGGGGASANWAGVDLSVPSGGGGGSDIDLEDGFWVLLVLAAVIAVIFGAAGYLIYIAPELLPEAALQAALASSLAGIAKRRDDAGWVGGVVRSTAIPFLIVLALTCGLAFTVHHTCPGARKLMEALSCPGA